MVGGGSDVMMACWNVCRLSYSLSSPHALCRSWRLVPEGLLLDQLSGRDWMSFFTVVVVGGDNGDEVGDGGSLIWGVVGSEW